MIDLDYGNSIADQIAIQSVVYNMLRRNTRVRILKNKIVNEDLTFVVKGRTFHYSQPIEAAEGGNT